MKEIRKRLTYANVMSSLAVFMVLGGGAAVASNHILPKNSVGTKQLKKNAVKTPKIAPSAVKTGKLGKEAVKAGKLANGAVLTDKIGDLAVTTGKLANESVLTDKLANDAVTTGKIANDAVTTDKIAPDAVTTGKIANDAVSTVKLAAGAVKASKLGTVTRRGVLVNVPNNTSRLGLASCLAGERAIAGGAAWVGVSDVTNVSELHVVHSFPNAATTSWSTRMFNNSGNPQDFNAYVLCLQAG